MDNVYRTGDLFGLAPLSLRDSTQGREVGGDWVRNMFAQKDAGYGYGYPMGGGLIDIDPLPLPSLDGDDPTMGLDILSSSESGNSAIRDFEVLNPLGAYLCLIGILGLFRLYHRRMHAQLALASSDYPWSTWDLS